MIFDIANKIKRKWMKFRLQPIRVFCFHQVSETFDASTMYSGDWTQTEQFKRNIEQLKKQYIFIPLREAHQKLQHDAVRCKRYAVLTADDGWASLKNILPWLAEQEIPITLFVNPAYLKGEETRENGMNGLLTWDDLKELLALYTNISIASHGWNHALATDVEIFDFQETTIKSVHYLRRFKNYIPFYAYPCGNHTKDTDAILENAGIVPVYMDGKMNYGYGGGIHRELLDGVIVNSEK